MMPLHAPAQVQIPLLERNQLAAHLQETQDDTAHTFVRTHHRIVITTLSICCQVEENMLSDRWGSIRGPQTAAAGTSGPMSTLSAGLSCLPSLFGLHFSGLTEQGGPAEGLSPEQAQQALLSRLLLLLGSMVILCLLLF